MGIVFHLKSHIFLVRKRMLWKPRFSRRFASMCPRFQSTATPPNTDSKAESWVLSVGVSPWHGHWFLPAWQAVRLTLCLVKAANTLDQRKALAFISEKEIFRVVIPYINRNISFLPFSMLGQTAALSQTFAYISLSFTSFGWPRMYDHGRLKFPCHCLLQYSSSSAGPRGTASLLFIMVNAHFVLWHVWPQSLVCGVGDIRWKQVFSLCNEYVFGVLLVFFLSWFRIINSSSKVGFYPFQIESVCFL